MSTFILIHGAGDSGWSWNLVAEELKSLGHDVFSPDLPIDDESLTFDNYADAVVDMVDDRDDVVVVGHSFGGFTAPLVAERLQADALILLAAMIPSPGENSGDWWANTGFTDAVSRQAELDGGLTGHEDPYISFYNNVPRHLADEALSRERAHPSSTAASQLWPLPAWPNISTRFILFRDDRFFPADFFRTLVPQRLGIVPEELPGGHCAMLSDPKGLAALLQNGATS